MPTHVFSCLLSRSLLVQGAGRVATHVRDEEAAVLAHGDAAGVAELVPRLPAAAAGDLGSGHLREPSASGLHCTLYARKSCT